MPKLAWAMIVKGDDKEAVLLDRCLNSIMDYVDGLFVTVTHKKGEEPNKACVDVIKKYGGVVSYFEWVKDFSKARNFSFKQVPKEYDYIGWCDADDIWRGMDKLKDTIKDNKNVDAFAFWYLYDFDEFREATVVHKKTQIVRNDNCVEWKGALHEDFKENRSLEVKFVDGIERLHLTNEERIVTAQQRNVEVSESDRENNPNDPRVYWNVANSYMGASMYDKAKDAFKHFITLSDSDDEKYLAIMRLAEICHKEQKRDDAINYMYQAIGMKPDTPDAYHQIGYMLYEYNRWDKAEEYLLAGLVKKPKYHSMIVYNPRDYDYNPMMLLAKVYYQKNRADLALPMLKGCLKIYPKNDYLKGLVSEMESEMAKLTRAVEVVNSLKEETDKDKIKKEIESLPPEVRSHPAVCALWNKHFIKTESSGKDIVYYCGHTTHEFNPLLFKKKGFGGSEEAVINLAREWSKQGYNVTVYNNCGTQMMVDEGVTYRPFWEFNVRDRQDHVILWRSPKPLDFDINCENIYVDMHDVIPSGEFNEKRTAKLKKVFVKTQAHRELFPQVPDEKIAIIPNGQDFSLFNQDVNKDQYLIINTSSPDRSMEAMPYLFNEIKKRVPEAKMKWAYGWDIFNASHGMNPKMAKWRDDLQKSLNDAGIISLGKIPQSECAKLYLEGNVLLYPTEFFEIDCISVKKAQACGCIPVTTDFAALNESVQFGVKIRSEKTKDNWAVDYQNSFAVTDKAMLDKMVEATVEILKKPIEDRSEMIDWTHKFEWELIAKRWIKELK